MDQTNTYFRILISLAHLLTSSQPVRHCSTGFWPSRYDSLIKLYPSRPLIFIDNATQARFVSSCKEFQYGFALKVKIFFSSNCVEQLCKLILWNEYWYKQLIIERIKIHLIEFQENTIAFECYKFQEFSFSIPNSQYK